MRTIGPELDWLRLYRSEGVGPRTFRILVNRFGSARGALEALPKLATRSGARIAICSVADGEGEMAAAARAGVRFIAMGEEGYSHPLAQIADPPPLIGVRGNLGAFQRPAVAIVGSRNASVAGMRMAEILARGVGEHGYVIVSGLARGIDARAHEASLATATIAVLAGGLDRVYPPNHEPLAARILAAGGALLSEMPMGWAPRGRDFPRRNRIISGLSLGVVVVEAARKSGSLITARFALEQADAVMCEAVCVRRFPDRRRNTGNFAKIAVFGQLRSSDAGRVSKRWTLNSLDLGAGNLWHAMRRIRE